MSAPTTTTLSHGNYCACGKWAKFHVSHADGRCGNVCGVHKNGEVKRGADVVNAWSVSICDDCGEHCVGGSTTSYSLRGDGKTETWCRACDRVRRAAR